jgi:aldehyde:ferredoxin oxidoreductase
MAYGWTGCILRVDLTTGSIKKTPSSDYMRDYIGGRGVNARLLYEESRAGVDPPAPEAPLIFGWGPTVGASVFGGNRTCVTFRPYPKDTNWNYAFGHFGGFFGAEAKFAGYDHLVITGRAEKPVYLHIRNEEVTIRDASHLWGKDTFTTANIIKEKEPETQVLSIGIAGENLSAFATIEHYYRASGMKGAGTAMGSKNLKAIAIRGTGPVRMHDPAAVLQLNAEFLPRARAFRNAVGGLPLGVSLFDPATYFRNATHGVIGNYEGFVGMPWSELEKVSLIQEWNRHKAGTGRSACLNCPSYCMGIVDEPGVGLVVQHCMSWRPWRVWCADPSLWNRAVRLMDRLGVCNHSFPSALAWLMELYHRGIITASDTDGIPMERGSEQAIFATIEKVAKREGFGNILADGVDAFARHIGKGADYYLMAKKGVLISQSSDWRVAPYRALSWTMATRGDTMTSGEAFEYMGPGKEFAKAHLAGDQEGMSKAIEAGKSYFGHEKAAIPWEYEGKAKPLAQMELSRVVSDLMGWCEYLRIGLMYNWFDYPAMQERILKAVTGVDADLFAMANKAWTLERVYQVREGHRGRPDDTIPLRVLTEPAPDGPDKGAKINQEKLEKMKDEYYEARGFDPQTGLPTEARLEAIGLADMTDNLKQLGKM